jgi:tRNA threonylcarbamoyl adenosine modification protein (Sua5/YciO/YrdC/YwlC family)
MRTFGIHDLDEMAALLKEGHVVALPTDTVYGLAARPDQARGIEAIYRLKGRPASLALPILAATLDDVLGLVGRLPSVAVTLARAFWPGALTLVVDASPALARQVCSSEDTVGFRVPDLALARRLLARSGPLAVTSANRHGEEPCTSAADVRACFSRPPQPSGVLDGGAAAGEPSTIVAVRGQGIEILRQGALSEGELRAALG